MKTVILDIDGVLADFGTHFLSYLDFEDKSPAKDWNDPRFIENMHKIANDKNFWMTIPKLITPDEIDFIVHSYVTARPLNTHSWTQDWLDFHGFPDAKLITVKKDKRPFLGGADLFVDDSIENYEAAKSVGQPAKLMTRSHNKNYITPDRIYSLKEIMLEEKLKELEEDGEPSGLLRAMLHQLRMPV